VLIQIASINSRSTPTDLGLIKTTFTTKSGVSTYIFTKPENVPNVGTELDGDIAPDKYGKLKFTKTKQPYPAVTETVQNSQKVYKADPDKMAQEKNLEIAKNKAIMRQVAVKAAVELTLAKFEDYDKNVFRSVYVDCMELLSEPDWTVFKVTDVLPTDEEVEEGPDWDNDEPFTS